MALPAKEVLVSPTVVGRDRELESVDSMIHRVRQGRGRTLILAGEAGIGKSRLINEAEHRFQETFEPHPLIFRGECYEIDRNHPYAPIEQTFRTWLTRDPNTAREVIGPDLTSVMDDLHASGSNLPEVNLLRSGGEKRWIFQSLVRVIKRAAQTQPLMMIVEDLHWADELSLEFLPYLARSLNDDPIFLLLSYRSDEIQPSLLSMLAAMDRERVAVEQTLSPLQRPDIDRLLRAMFGQPHPIRSDFLAMLARLTDGNPFFIEEVLRSLVTSGDIFREQGHWERKDLEDLHVPRTVRDAVWRRASDLSSEAKDALAVAAVVGRRFDFAVLRSLTGFAETELLRCIREIVDTQLVVEEIDDSFAFRHELTRQAVYSQLLSRERQLLHRSIANLFESMMSSEGEQRLFEIAYHYEHARQWDKTLQFAVRSGERAEMLHAPGTAADHFSRAIEAGRQLDLPPDPELLRRRALAYATLGQFEQSEQDIERLLALVQTSGDQQREWEALLDLGRIWTGRDYSHAGNYFRKASELAKALDDRAATAQTLLHLGSWQVNVERVDDARDTLTQSMRLFDALGDARGRAESLDLLGVVDDVSGDLRSMANRHQRARRLYEQLDDRKGMASADANLAALAGAYVLVDTVSLSSGLSASEAEQAGARAISVMREIEWRSGEAFALYSLGSHLAGQGAFDRAFDLGVRSVEASSEIEHHEWLANGNALLGSIFTWLMDHRKAGEQFEKAVDAAHSSGSVWLQRQVTGLLGANLIRAGELEEANDLLSRAEIELPMNTIGSRLLWCSKARLALSSGDPETALDIVERLRTTAANRQRADDIPTLEELRAAALLALGRVNDAEQALSDACSGAVRFGLRPLLLRVYLSQASMYQTMNRADDAANAYRQARELAGQLSSAVHSEETAAGFRDRVMQQIPEHFIPGGQLTPRERDVAGLLVQGMSNRQIAETLYISERTVESHIGSILSKHGFTSRTQIVAWMTDSEFQSPEN